jgi:hypothetical protein
MTKIKNFNLQSLITIYVKLFEADFPTTKDSLDHIDKTTKLEAFFAITDKARQSIVKKFKLDGENKDNEEINKKANEEYVKVMMEEVEVELTPFDVEVLKSAPTLKPVEIMLLKNLNLLKENAPAKAEEE